MWIKWHGITSTEMKPSNHHVLVVCQNGVIYFYRAECQYQNSQEFCLIGIMQTFFLMLKKFLVNERYHCGKYTHYRDLCVILTNKDIILSFYSYSAWEKTDVLKIFLRNAYLMYYDSEILNLYLYHICSTVEFVLQWMVRYKLSDCFTFFFFTFPKKNMSAQSLSGIILYAFLALVVSPLFVHLKYLGTIL